MVGFHIPGLLSSFITTALAAVEFTTVKDHPEQLRTWVNTFAGETFEDAGDVIDHNSVMERREEYDGEVPDGGFNFDTGLSRSERQVGNPGDGSRG